MTFSWSDAWILQAVILVSQRGPASLTEIVGAADAVQHAMPTVQEIQGALHRLGVAGFVEEVDGRFSRGTKVPPTVTSRIVAARMSEGTKIACQFLGVDEPARDHQPNQQAVGIQSPTITEAIYRAAVQGYERTWDAFHQKAKS